MKALAPVLGAESPLDDETTSPQHAVLLPLARRVADALAAVPADEAEELWAVLRALQCMSRERRRAVLAVMASPVRTRSGTRMAVRP